MTPEAADSKGQQRTSAPPLEVESFIDGLEHTNDDDFHPHPTHHHDDLRGDPADADTPSTTTATATEITGAGGIRRQWKPSNTDPLSWWSWKDFWYFVGPGWFVSIAYVDPGNYQADIQAGSTTRYYLLFAIWWTSLLSIYVQVLCVRLAYYGNCNLAQAQSKEHERQEHHNPTFFRNLRYFNWAVAELSTIVTDLPEVIGIGIACNAFFGWPYYVGVLLSLVTTMIFLATMNLGVHILERIIFGFVGIMSIALWIEMAMVKPDIKEVVDGWFFGFTEVNSSDIFAIAGILGAVVMPHNLYLHTAAVQARPVAPSAVNQAVLYSSWEPVVPILVSFFVNMAVVAIAAESVYGFVEDAGDTVGLTNFCDYFTTIKGGCILWGIALLAAGQSSAITTTYTGQYVMDGFLQMQIPVQWRAIITRFIAITPCVIVSILFPKNLNAMVNIVNASLSFLLPFALTPLIKFNCSHRVMGKEHASRGMEKFVLHLFAILVWGINAVALSTNGGGFFGDIRGRGDGTWGLLVVELLIQTLYAWWNWYTLFGGVAEVEYHEAPVILLDSRHDDFQQALNEELQDDNDDDDDDGMRLTHPYSDDVDGDDPMIFS